MTRKDGQTYKNLSRDEMEIGLLVARVGLGRVDYRQDTLRLDPLSAEMFGLPSGRDIPRDDLHARIHPEDWPEVERHVERLLDPTRPDILDLTHRILHPDGSVRWVNARKEVQFADATQGARPLTGIFAVVDITDRKRAEIRSDMLIGELNHRTKNLIAVVSGIARQLKRHAEGEDFAERLISRLTALAQNQDAIARSNPGAFDLRGLIKAQMTPFEGRRAARVALHGPDLEISASAAQVLGMVAHELLTNAVKYGALSGEAGIVELSWAVTEGDPARFSLIWRETGGPPVAAPSTRGFGHQVLTRLMESSLEAEVSLDYDPEGLRAAFDLPLERLLSA